jgi:hypothetical protein
VADPANSLYVPAAQDAHVASPSHDQHCEAELRLDKPFAHVEHEVLPAAALNDPDVHGTHEVADDAL